MEPDRSVTMWIHALKEGDEQAARVLWEKYFQRVVGLARRRFGDTPRRVSDEEDIAVSVFRRLYEQAEERRFDRLADREDLWRLLASMTRRRVIDEQRWSGAEKRGGGQVHGESIFAQAGDASQAIGGIGDFAEDEPTPEFLIKMAEEHQRLLGMLDDDTLREVALLKLDGYMNAEIAEKLSLTTRSIERKLKRIRDLWGEENMTGDSLDP